MRDPNRIDPFLEELGKLWKEYPDFRFGQLLKNVFGDRDPFYLEEYEFLARVKTYVESMKK